MRLKGAENLLSMFNCLLNETLINFTTRVAFENPCIRERLVKVFEADPERDFRALSLRGAS